MKFRTEYEARPAARLLDPKKPAVLIGSCFTDYIGERMRTCRWRAFPNITGTLFNPASIAKTLRIAIQRDTTHEIIRDSTATQEPLRVSWLTDSACTTYDRRDTENRVADRMFSLYERLQRAGVLIVTFGTAWVYELRERPGYIVANCHKFPADTFIRRRLSIDEITSEWNSLLQLLASAYPELRVIFTVSPVRHLKDGFEGNSSSKAILRLACEEICAANAQAEYFPAFEIVNDDLRDYRFYASDMVHPSDMAVDYIWQKFQDRYLSPASRALLAEGEKVTRRLRHRPRQYGDSERAQYDAYLRQREASQYYNDFIGAHPDMLYIDE